MALGLITGIVPPVKFVTDNVEYEVLLWVIYTGKLAAPPVGIVSQLCRTVTVGGGAGGAVKVAVYVAGDEPAVIWCVCAPLSDQYEKVNWVPFADWGLGVAPMVESARRMKTNRIASLVAVLAAAVLIFCGLIRAADTNLQI